MTEALLLLLSLALVAACGIFVAAEFSFVTVDRPTVERAAAGGDRRSRGVLSALRNLSTQLSGAQIGITVTNLAIGFLAEPAIARLLRGPLTSLGASESLARAASVTIALLLATGVTMLYGELVPKNLAIAHPLGTARVVQGPQRAFTRATGLLIRTLNNTANAILQRMNITPQEELASARSPQELVSLVGRSAEHGVLPRETAVLLRRSLLFGDRTAEDVMTPRMRMQTVQADAPVSEVIAMTRRTGHARYPVLGEGSDDVVGLVHVKHAVRVPETERETVRVRDVMVPPVTVPSSIPLDPLLETLRAGGLQMAIVVDEFGGTDGLVTVEDLVEEIVGDVVDEHDRVSPSALRRRDGSWLVSGLLRPEEASEITELEIPSDDAYQTLGGLVSRLLGRIPRNGDVVELDGIRYKVERMDGRRVDRIRLERVAAPDGSDASPEPAARHDTGQHAAHRGDSARHGNHDRHDKHDRHDNNRHSNNSRHGDRARRGEHDRDRNGDHDRDHDRDRNGDKEQHGRHDRRGARLPRLGGGRTERAGQPEPVGGLGSGGDSPAERGAVVTRGTPA